MKEGFKEIVLNEMIKGVMRNNPKATLEELQVITNAFETGFDVGRITDEPSQEMFLILLRNQS